MASRCYVKFVIFAIKMADEIEIITNEKRNRKANFTASECSLILEEAEKHIDVIKSKFSTVITNKKKKQTWQDITSKVNALGVSERTAAEIKDKWRSMVSSAKKTHNSIAKNRKQTGGKKSQRHQRRQQ